MSKDFKYNLDLKEEAAPAKRSYVKLDKVQMFDIEENMMMNMLHNLKRADTIACAKQYCESVGLEKLSDKRLIAIYNSAREKLFNRRLDTVEEEKKKLVKSLYRLAVKAETRGDFANAYKSYNRIAELAGVDKENDDSKVVLNFVQAKPLKKPAAEEILDAEYRTADNEEKKDEKPS